MKYDIFGLNEVRWNESGDYRVMPSGAKKELQKLDPEKSGHIVD